MSNELSVGHHTFIIEGPLPAGDISIGTIKQWLEVAGVVPPFVREDGKIEFSIDIIDPSAPTTITLSIGESQ